MKLGELSRTALEIGFGTSDLLFHSLILKLNLFTCGQTVLGTWSIKGVDRIYIHDHPLRHPASGPMNTIHKGDALHPVAAYVDPIGGLVIEPYDPNKHGAIDWSNWLNEGDPGPGGKIHKHVNTSCAA